MYGCLMGPSWSPTTSLHQKFYMIINEVPSFFLGFRLDIKFNFCKQLHFMPGKYPSLCLLYGQLHVKLISVPSRPSSFPSAASLYFQTTLLPASCPCHSKSNSAFFLFSTPPPPSLPLSSSLLPPPKCKLMTLQ